MFVPIQIALGILLGQLLYDWFHERFPPDDPDAFV